jgi:hypothetical protein
VNIELYNRKQEMSNTKNESKNKRPKPAWMRGYRFVEEEDCVVVPETEKEKRKRIAEQVQREKELKYKFADDEDDEVIDLTKYCKIVTVRFDQEIPDFKVLSLDDFVKDNEPKYKFVDDEEETPEEIKKRDYAQQLKDLDEDFDEAVEKALFKAQKEKKGYDGLTPLEYSAVSDHVQYNMAHCDCFYCAKDFKAASDLVDAMEQYRYDDDDC